MQKSSALLCELAIYLAYRHALQFEDNAAFCYVNVALTKPYCNKIKKKRCVCKKQPFQPLWH